jgi:hypothetical protein
LNIPTSLTKIGDATRARDCIDTLGLEGLKLVFNKFDEILKGLIRVVDSINVFSSNESNNFIRNPMDEDR